MPKYKPTYEDQTVFIHLSASNQFQVESFEFAINILMENEIDSSVFEKNRKNENLGASAYHPKVLLKIILMAYSMGVTSSRAMSQLCQNNTTFMILSGYSFPKKSKIASFISSHPNEVESVFLQVLSVCYNEGLVGNQMFAIDGCKMPSNASKEHSGTRAEFKRKKKKLEKAIHYMISKHQADDTKKIAPDRYQAEQKQIAKLKLVNRKIKMFLSNNQDKPGTRKNPVKSNITDNESAKMKCAKGVIQGVNAVTLADAKHQVILGMQVFDSVDERPSLKPLIDQVKERLQHFFPDQEILKKIQFLADSGFCSEANLKYLVKEGIDAYIADNQFRKRDPRFKDALKNHSNRLNPQNKYTLDDFYYDPKTNRCICPMGKTLWLKSPNAMAQGFPTIRFQAHVKDCRDCEKRKKCLKNENQQSPRQVSFRKGDSNHLQYTELMKKKIDSDRGRAIYNKRLGIIEPIFANITATLKLNRLSFRGKEKNNAQWKLFCIVHNIGKIMKYGNLVKS